MGQWVAVTLSISSRFACLFCCCKAWPGKEVSLGRVWVWRWVLRGRISHGLGSHLDPGNHQTPALCVCLYLQPPPSLTSFTYMLSAAFLFLKINISYTWSPGIPFEPKAQQEIKIMSQYPDWRQSRSILWALWWVFVEFQPTAIIIISLLQPS